MATNFLEQVQFLMQIQQIKQSESSFGNKSSYQWLCARKNQIIWISVRDEFLIRQALNKVTIDQQTKVIKQLLIWLEEHPEAHYLKIPEKSQHLLNNMATSNLVNEVTISRLTSFRSSLRRFSRLKNRIGPTEITLEDFSPLPRRSVTFNDVPIVYQILK